MVENALAAGAVAIAVTSHTLFNIIVIDLGVKEGFDASFEAEFVVINCDVTD